MWSDLKDFINPDHFPVFIREIIMLAVCSSNITGKGFVSYEQFLNSVNEHKTQLKDGEGKTIVDCTFGAGGYSKALLKYSKYNVIAIDRDHSCLPAAKLLEQEYGDRFKFFHSKFSNIKTILQELNLNQVDAVIADLGVSSMQLNTANRGFSFQKDGKLSMEMGLNETSAERFINNSSEQEIAKVLWEYGEERKSRFIAKAIVKARQIQPVKSTQNLKDIIHNALGYKVNKKGKDISTKSFQAIRIHVNGELHELLYLMNTLPTILSPQGKVIMVTFHSLEDRIVKNFFKALSNKLNSEEKSNKFTLFKSLSNIILEDYINLTSKAWLPTPEEIKINRNSECAKLRAIQKGIS